MSATVHPLPIAEDNLTADEATILRCVREAVDHIEGYDPSKPDAAPPSPWRAAWRLTVGELLDFDAGHIPGDLLRLVHACDIAPTLEALVDGCEEIDIPVGMADRVQVVWKRKATERDGHVTLGTLGAVSKKDRELGSPYLWRLTLALDTWLLTDEERRVQVLHHELMHAVYEGGKPKTRTHDVEEFAANVARYGLLDEGRARFLAQAMARPRIVEELQVYGVDPVSGQGLLFAADKMRPVGA
jgi:hypothetical protein